MKNWPQGSGLRKSKWAEGQEDKSLRQTCIYPSGSPWSLHYNYLEVKKKKQKN